MATTVFIVFALFLAYSAAQMRPPPAFFTIPSTPLNRGGRVNFGGGISLGQVCKQMMMFGGKEALSDGMGAAAKWFASQKIAGNVAGGSDPHMQCLYSQATGSMPGVPGMVGAKDPGNMFGDYFDTVIEYPMVLDPCTAPQCNGNVNPTVLLMQKYAPMMRRSFGGMGGGMGFPMGGGMNFPMGGAMTSPMGGALNNPMAALMGLSGQSPLLSALMPKMPTPAVQKPTVGTSITPSAPQPAAPVPSIPATVPSLPQANQMGQMAKMFSNPQMMQMFQQFLASQMGNAAKPSPVAAPVASPSLTGGFPAFAGGLPRMPNIFF